MGTWTTVHGVLPQGPPHRVPCRGTAGAGGWTLGCRVRGQGAGRGLRGAGGPGDPGMRAGGTSGVGGRPSRARCAAPNTHATPLGGPQPRQPRVPAAAVRDAGPATITPGALRSDRLPGGPAALGAPCGLTVPAPRLGL